MAVRLMDHTDSLWATVFNEAGATLLGVPASEVADICENRVRTPMHTASSIPRCFPSNPPR